MSEWKEYKIEDFCEVIGGGTPSTKEDAFYGGNVPWITPRDLTNYKNRFISTGERNITELGLRNSSARLLPKNTILLTSRAPIGYLAIASNEVCTNQGFKSLIVNPKIADFNFIYYLIKSNIEKIKSLGTGTTFAEISGAVIKSLKFKIPDLPTQTAIAEILSSLDDKIELNNKINQELESLAQTLFKQWFIDFEFPNENGEPYKSSGGEMVDSELGEIPKGWGIGNLGSLVGIVNGYAFKSKDFNNSLEEGIIKIRNINGTTVDLINTDFVSTEKVYKLNDKFKVKSGDILIAMTGAEVGKIGVVGKTNKRLWLNQRVGKLMPKTNKQVSYIHTMYNVLNLSEVVRNEALGSAQPNISSQGIESIKLLMPKTSLITMFSELFDDKFKWFLSTIAENQEMINLRDTLLPKLISGELEINEISN